jgi:integrase
VARGTYLPRDKNPVLVDELYAWLQQRYTMNNCKSGGALARRWKHLQPWFGDWQAQNVVTERIDEYVAARLRENAANGTVNRELAGLKAMFRIGYNKRRLQRLPLFPSLREANARTGFIEDADYAKLTANAGALWLRLFLELGFSYGWRKQELLGLRVHQCDLVAKSIRLEAAQSKNGEAREVAMTGAVYELVKQSIVGKGPDDYLLTRDGGKPVKDFRRSWQALCTKAGLGKMVCRSCGKTITGARCECGSKLQPRYTGRIVHDMRRSAAKALRRAGVAESVIMKIGGWRTRAMFDRYAIVSDADQKQAVELLEAKRLETVERARAVEQANAVPPDSTVQ